MEFRTIFAGFGGQGIISMGKMIAQAGMASDKNVTFYPAYGIAMRGGTANCSVIVSDDEIASPIIPNPNLLVVMNTPSLDFFIERLESGGTLIINSSLVKKTPPRDDVSVYTTPSSEIAEALGNGRMANMAMIGAIIKATGMLPFDALTDVLGAFFSGKKASLIPLNRDAMQKGYDSI